MFKIIRELRYPAEFRITKFKRRYSSRKILNIAVEKLEKWTEDWLHGEELKTIAQVDIISQALREMLHRLKEKKWSDNELINISRVVWRLKKRIVYFEKKFEKSLDFKSLTVSISLLDGIV